MDVRMHWSRLHEPESPALLEFLICLFVIGSMTWVAARGMHRIQQHLYVLDALSLASASEVAMMEYRATHGVWPDSNDSLSVDAAQAHSGGRVDAETIQAGGAFDFRFSGRTNEVAGKTVTFRAWQASGASDLPVVWSCGHARARPLTAVSEDRTTLDDRELPAPCRARN
jgi:Pilin (bacterial filament)